MSAIAELRDALIVAIAKVWPTDVLQLRETYVARTAGASSSAICAGNYVSMSLRDAHTRYYSCVLPVSTEYAAVISRVSTSQRHRYVVSCTDGRWTCTSSPGDVRFTQLKNICWSNFSDGDDECVSQLRDGWHYVAQTCYDRRLSIDKVTAYWNAICANTHGWKSIATCKVMNLINFGVPATLSTRVACRHAYPPRAAGKSDNKICVQCEYHQDTIDNTFTLW